MSDTTLPPEREIDVEAVEEAMRSSPLLMAMERDKVPLPVEFDHQRARVLRRGYRAECGYAVPAHLWLELSTACLLAEERERVLLTVANIEEYCTGCMKRDELRRTKPGVEQTTWGAGAWVHVLRDGSRHRCGLSAVRQALEKEQP